MIRFNASPLELMLHIRSTILLLAIVTAPGAVVVSAQEQFDQISAQSPPRSAVSSPTRIPILVAISSTTPLVVRAHTLAAIYLGHKL